MDAGPHSVTGGGGGFPTHSCGADGIMLWGGGNLSQRWFPGKGWTSLSGTDHGSPLTKSGEGAGFVLAAAGSLEPIDPQSGGPVNPGAELAPHKLASGPPAALALILHGAD